MGAGDEDPRRRAGVRRRLYGAFEIAETLPPGPERDAWLTFAVPAADPTGVELAGQIREIATASWPTSFTASNRKTRRVLLFDGGTAGQSFAPQLTDKAASILEI